jgi:uncharacterized membrane protein (UPF0127 family)
VHHAPITEDRRTSSLPSRLLHGSRVRVAVSRRSRLLGLAGIHRAAAPEGLLIPGCRSIHTFGMRFPLDVRFLDSDLNEVSRRPAVPRRRIVLDRSASAVLEIPAGGAD